MPTSLLIGVVLLQAPFACGWSAASAAGVRVLDPSHSTARCGTAPPLTCRSGADPVAMAARKRGRSAEPPADEPSEDSAWELDFRFSDDEDGASPDGASAGAVVDLVEEEFAPEESPVAKDGWEEPSGTPAEDEEVYTSEMYLPILLERKYGKDWEELVANAEINENEFDLSSLSREGAEEAAGYSEDELRRRIRQQQELDAGELASDELDSALEAAARLDELEEDPEENPEENPEEAQLDEDISPIEILAGADAELSPSLVDFVRAQQEGDVEDLPGEYPESEWLRVWLTACGDARSEQVAALYANLRVLLHSNFGDFEIVDAASTGQTGVEEAREQLKERARFKARTVFEATGLPAIAESRCVYVDASGNKPASEVLVDASDEAVGALLERSRRSSDKERPVVYCAATAFCRAESDDNCDWLDGCGEMQMPITFASAEHSTVALSVAHDELFVQVSEGLGLPFVGTMGAFDDFYDQQLLKGSGKLRKKTAGGALLKQKLLREATLLDTDIIKVSSFLNHMVDVELMEACGEELAERLEETSPTKVLTVEATGLLPAVFVGKALGLPVIFARKSRQIGVSDSYQASYKSHMLSSTTDIYVSTEYLVPGDRVLIIDDFLAGGRTADAMIRICRMANANVVGGGFLIEKRRDAGRAFLSGYEVASCGGAALGAAWDDVWAMFGRCFGRTF